MPETFSQFYARQQGGASPLGYKEAKNEYSRLYPDLTKIAKPEEATKLIEGSEAFKLEEPKVEPIDVKTEPETIDDVVSSVKQNEYSKTLQSLDFGSGQLSTVQKLINYMPEETEQQRINKNKAQQALSGYSSSGASYFENPLAGEVSAEGMLEDLEKVQGELRAQQAEEKSYTEQQIEAANLADTTAFKKSAATGQSAVSATTAQFAQSREGAASFTNPLISSEFEEGVNKQLNVARTQLEANMAQRERLLKQLDEAHKNQNDKLAESLSKQLAATASNIAQLQTETATLQAKNSAEAFDRITKLSALSKDAGGGIFTGWTAQDIADTFSIDIGTAATVANLDARIASTDTSQIDYQQKVANLRKTQNEAIYSGMTTTQRDFIFAQGLQGKNRDDYLNFAGKNPNYGFMKDNMGNIFSTNPENGDIKQLTGSGGGGTKLIPSGVQTQGIVNGKVVTLDSNAMFALQTANGAAIAGGMPGINVTSSTRDQKQTILGMAAKWGVEVDASSIESVNQAAATLTAMGHSVAAVGYSNHETGMAVDIYPSDPASQDNASAQAYIAKMKPFMEANGWKQSTDPGDRGHFNFVGTTIYSDEQRAVMDSIDMRKYDGTDAKSLTGAGLTYGDLASFRSTQGLTPEQKKAADNVRIKNQSALNAIQYIEDEKLWKGAGVIGSLPWNMTREDLQAQIDTVVANIALDEMKALKDASPTGSTGFGQLSEKELTVLTSSKGAIRAEMGEKLLQNNLKQIKEILLKAQGISESPEMDNIKIKQLTDPVKIGQVNSMIDTLETEGIPMMDIVNKLSELGYDPTQFLNIE